MNGWALRQQLVLSVVAVVVLSVVLSVLDQPLRTGVAEYGIVSFELAGDWQTTWLILSGWDATARLHAALMLGLDYLYLLVYPWCLSCACRMTVRSLSDHTQATPVVTDIGVVIAALVWLAAPLDGLENYALWQMLNEAPGGVWPAMAAYCAIPKFILVGVAIAYVVVGQVLRLLKRATKPS